MVACWREDKTSPVWFPRTLQHNAAHTRVGDWQRKNESCCAHGNAGSLACLFAFFTACRVKIVSFISCVSGDFLILRPTAAFRVLFKKMCVRNKQKKRGRGSYACHNRDGIHQSCIIPSLRVELHFLTVGFLLIPILFVVAQSEVPRPRISSQRKE